MPENSRLGEMLRRDLTAACKYTFQVLNPAEKTGPEGFLIGVNWRGDVNSSQTPAMQARSRQG